jgi:membrane-associated protease RseP (regulator of RpoE activity)
VENKKTKSKLSALWAFLFGIILMLGVYILFESAPNRLRSGSTDDNTDTTGNIVKTANIVQTAIVEDVPVRPSVFFGVEVLSVNPIIAEQLSLPGEHGVLINRVLDGSPAQTAGLQRGDVILSLDKKAVEDIDSFRQLLATYNPGDNVRIAYIRNAQKDTVYARLAAIPDGLATVQADDSKDTDWGVSLSNIGAAVRNSLNIPADIDGIAILSITPGGAADEAGLKPGDVITGIDQTPVSSMDEFFRELSADNDNIALLDVYSRGSVRYVPIDSSGMIDTADTTPTQTQTLRQRMLSMLTGGIPFTNDDDEEEEGPKGGKFAQDDNVQLTADNTAFNRPSTVPGDENTGGSTTSTTGMNRPSSVPSQSGGPANDTVLFIGLLILLILYLSYREYTRPAEVKTK